MNEPTHADQTVDIPVAESSLAEDAALDVALAEAFAPDSGPALPGGASVLKALAASLPAVPRINLREPDNDPATPVVRPRSSAMPGASDPSGRYQMVGEIARGGMGAVLKGRDVDLGRDIAVKVLLETHAGRTEFLQRFVEEAQISGQLQHPGIVPVYELGQFTDKRPYFTMKLVKGQTLAKLLAERRKREPGQADVARYLKIFEQVCQTLAYAHARGVIHRDLKPANIMVGTFGEVQVMDWGLAKVLAEGGLADEAKASRGHHSPDPEPTMIRTVRSDGTEQAGSVGSFTLAGSVLGTPAYMAPEQARGDVDLIDERADVFGLGALLCEILTGQPPFTGKQAEAMRKAQTGDVTDALARLSQCDADGDLIGLAQRCLAAEPWHRPRDAGVVAKEVTAYLESVQVRLHKAELARAEEVVRTEAAQATAAEERKAREAAQARAVAERRAQRMTLALAASVLLLIGVGGGGWLWLERQQEARLAETTLAVNAALNEAAQLRAQAQEAHGSDPALWAKVLAAARRAEGLLAGGEGNDELRRRVQELLDEVADEEKDRRMAARLDEIRAELAERGEETRRDYAGAARRYHEAFRDYGLDIESLSAEEAVQAIGARAIAVELAVGLDGWSAVNRHVEPKGVFWQRLLEIAQAADPDPWRQSYRSAVLKADRQALKDLAAAADVTALSGTSLGLLGAQLGWSGDHAEAEILLRKAQLQYPGDFWVNYNLALACQFMRPPKRAEAIRFHNSALTVRPQSIDACRRLGLVLQESGRHAEAAFVFKKATALAPGHAEIHWRLGHALGFTEDWAAAIAAFEKSLALKSDDFWALLNYGWMFGRKKDWDQAIAFYQKAIPQNPSYPRAHYELAGFHLEKKDLDQAVLACQEAVRLNKDYGDAYLRLGLTLQKQGLDDDAITAFKETIRCNPKSGMAHYNLAHQLSRKGELDAAIGHFQETIRLNPKDAIANNELGVVFRRKKEWDRAIDAFREAIRLKKDYRLAHQNLGTALAIKKDWDGALAAYQEALGIGSEQAGLRYEMARIHNQKKEWPQAIVAAQRALELNKDHTGALFELGFAYSQSGAVVDAVAKYEDYIGRQPGSAAAHYNLGVGYRKQGRLTESLAASRKAHELAANTPFAARTVVLLRESERLAALEAKLLGVQKGAAPPTDAAELVALGWFCQQPYKALNAAAAGYYEAGFAARPELGNIFGQDRYNAACAAALAGSGQGKDADRLSAPARAEWRKKAIQWLKADLAEYAKQLEVNRGAVNTGVQLRLQHWQRDADLRGLRDDAALAKLPAAEQTACRALWAEVAALLKTSQ